MLKKDKEHWVFYHLNRLEYFRRQFENKLSKVPLKNELYNLSESELRDVIKHIKDSIRWYSDGIEYHKTKALKHIDKEPEWSLKIGKLDSEVERRLCSLPYSQKLVKLDINKKRQLVIQLLDLANWFKDEIEAIRSNAFKSFNNSDKVKWIKEKSDLENKSLEYLFITADKMKPKYNNNFATASEHKDNKKDN